MGIASMIIGIVSALLGFVPLCNYLATIPAVVGLVLGIVDIVMKSEQKQSTGMGIAGIVLNVLALSMILIWTLIIKNSFDTFFSFTTNSDSMKIFSNFINNITNEQNISNIQRIIENIVTNK